MTIADFRKKNIESHRDCMNKQLCRPDGAFKTLRLHTLLKFGPAGTGTPNNILLSKISSYFLDSSAGEVENAKSKGRSEKAKVLFC
jgi:hypothetical protein